MVNLCAAQTTLPEFGDITPAEEALTECSFDKEADQFRGAFTNISTLLLFSLHV